MPSNEWLTITVGAILVNNIVLSRILGICPFLGVSKKIRTALGMGGAVIFVMGIASFVTACLYHWLLSKQLLSLDSLLWVEAVVAVTAVILIITFAEIVKQELAADRKSVV